MMPYSTFRSPCLLRPTILPSSTQRSLSSSNNSRWKELASTYAAKAKEAASDVTNNVSQHSQRYASRLYDNATGSLRNATSTARQKVMDTVTLRQSRERLRSSLEASQQALRDSVRNTQQRVAQSFLPAWNSFFWWSLAAVGVYGIASTVPKEIVRNLLSGDGPNTSNKKQEEGNDR